MYESHDYTYRTNTSPSPHPRTFKHITQLTSHLKSTDCIILLVSSKSSLAVNTSMLPSSVHSDDNTENDGREIPVWRRDAAHRWMKGDKTEDSSISLPSFLVKNVTCSRANSSFSFCTFQQPNIFWMGFT